MEIEPLCLIKDRVDRMGKQRGRGEEQERREGGRGRERGKEEEEKGGRKKKRGEGEAKTNEDSREISPKSRFFLFFFLTTSNVHFKALKFKLVKNCAGVPLGRVSMETCKATPRGGALQISHGYTPRLLKSTRGSSTPECPK